MGAKSGRTSLKGHPVLVVDDDARLRKRLVALLRQEEAEVREAGSLAEAREILAGADPDLVLLDVRLPDGSGLELLESRAFPAAAAVVVMTAEGGIDTVVAALRLGAADYLAKPFDPFEIPLVYARCQQRLGALRRLDHERRQRAVRTPDFFYGDGLREVHRQVERILETDRRLQDDLPPVLIRGETGTGKSTLARQLHDRGPRADQPFIELNCAALPTSLVEAELFGHERGAFTDAHESRVGLFEAAAGGTLLLDEISTMPVSAQAKLLTAIERRTIRRVGSSREIDVDARIIAASLEDLQRRSADGAFRADLYHRLHVLEIDLPPLRRRPEDIVPLAEHLLVGLKRRYRMPDAVLTDRGRERLAAYPWPGNVRELAHELERQLILTGGGELDFPLLGASGGAPSGGSAADWLNRDWRIPAEGFHIEAALLRLIDLAMEQTGGNLSAAARLLGVNRDYIRYRIQRRH